MPKELTIICFALLGLGADVLCFRQTLATFEGSTSDFFLLLLSQALIAAALLACVMLFTSRIRFKKS